MDELFTTYEISHTGLFVAEVELRVTADSQDNLSIEIDGTDLGKGIRDPQRHQWVPAEGFIVPVAALEAHVRARFPDEIADLVRTARLGERERQMVDARSAA